MNPDPARPGTRWPNRRLGNLLFLLYVALVALAVTFVILRKYGYL